MRVDIAAAASAALWFGPAAAPVFAPAAGAFGIRRRLESPQGIALTFDDGPHPEGTPAVLEALACRNATATFFLVGEQVERHPSLAAEVAAAGHEIATHGHRHALLLRRSPRELRADFEQAHDVIATATGTSPRLYRPPYGIFSGPALLIVRRLGLQPLLWSRWGRDWERRATPQSIAARAARELRGGDVILLHDSDSYSAVGSWRNTAAAIPAVLAAIDAAGEPLVSASQST